MEMGSKIRGRSNGKFAPLVIEGGSLKGIHYKSPVASAQVKSAILLAGLRAEGETSITEPSKSRDHTERMFRAFGVNVKVEGNTSKISTCNMLSPSNINVPGDISSAAFFIVAALIIPDSEVIIENVGLNPTRTGIITALKMIGADLEIKNEREEGGEPVGNIVVKSSDLKGIEVPEELVPSMIDEFPIFMIAASYADGITVIKGAEELRVKESDRISAMAEELEKMGVILEEKPDGVIITGMKHLKGSVCNSHQDHRVAMSMIIAGLGAEGETIVEDIGWINTSFPTFFSILNKILM
jgi:3-phosphoshikimate 1-carboxyvinyltransferase